MKRGLARGPISTTEFGRERWVARIEFTAV